MKQLIVLMLILVSGLTFGQASKKIELNKKYSDVPISKAANLTYELVLERGGLYQIWVKQQDIDIVLILADKTNKPILEQDTPNGPNSYERIDYAPTETKVYSLILKRLEDSRNPEEGKVTLFVKKYSKAEIQRKEEIKKELAAENAKTVQTLDIDHFWEAFDNLKKCQTHADSVASFQTLYIDRATSGLIDFMKVRNFHAERYVSTVARYPKFFNSVRKNTYEVKKAAPLIEEVFAKFKEIYPNFKPFKVCFAIGTLISGGTVSENFVLIGTEITTSSKDVDLSEFKDNAFSKVLAGEEDVVGKLKGIIAHECVHTQQIVPVDKNAITCKLLYDVMQEGFCDFIAELIAGNHFNTVVVEYGEAHEKELWKEFKSEMCKDNSDNWLYNYDSVKDRPADLGYYIGYKIAQAYYQQAKDKQQAIVDIIEMNNPLMFLEKSHYDQQEKK